MKLLPIVEPAPNLLREEKERYSRHLLLPDIGYIGQCRLKNAKVLVIGAGGLGSPALLYLAAAGVGTLGIIDFDDVEESNLQRQIIHGISDVGKNKADSARNAVENINPFIEVICHYERLEPENALLIISQYDLILDGTDNFSTRYLVNDACVLAKKPYVWGSIFRFEGQASVFWEDAPEGQGLNYRDLYPAPPPPEHAPSCSEGGVLGVLCAAIGSVMATEAIKLITGAGTSLLGRLMVYDALDMTYRTLPLRKAPNRKPIHALSDYQMLCGLNNTVSDVAVPQIAPLDLARILEQKATFQLVDVREPGEREICHIPSSVSIPQRDIISGKGLSQLDRQLPVILYCKMGGRSRKALLALQEQGFEDLKNLEGGILNWIQQVDPTMASY
ncbi:molybdopterin-synthase adenylyltransferase MoeB [Photobacterium sp. WH77]|uniref:molybdopterin-synthase adenylyltransferase MoeB n=1 Tax=unclassified Photobacterium TaxID=2628852 RepID=UPI001EDB339E|nr:MULTISPECIES: molybdopterin-synthase adenylyltransferase MoeB [unclassified Photobacterium]MCG2839062.1 molybdopterin-synthase adenylyltransferase MoeB [Photobacterium sp. WH77]MCG2846679.1 molybdopterin-synthase adenylyltransferase MoeB [Photobacterium sp. WH80]